MYVRVSIIMEADFNLAGIVTVRNEARQRGLQLLYKFDNGESVSVIRHKGSYGFEEGLFEIQTSIMEEEDDDGIRGCLTVVQVNAELVKAKESHNA